MRYTAVKMETSYTDDLVARWAETIVCPACSACGEFHLAKRVTATPGERVEWGCGRDSSHYECCVRAFVCESCGKRYAMGAEAPEME